MPPTANVTDFTDEQKKAYYNAAGLGTGIQTIDSSLLTAQSPINYQTPQDTPVYPVAGMTGPPEEQLTDQENKISAENDSLMGLIDQTLGRSAEKAALLNTEDYNNQLKADKELTARLTSLQNEALAIPLQLQQDVTGRGVTEGGLRPIQTAALRNNAIQALSTNALLQATKGNITFAQDMAEKAIAQKYDPIMEKIAAKQANLQILINDPKTSLQDRNRATAQKARQDALAAQAAKDQANQKDIYDIAITAAKYGADPQTLDRIMKSPDRNAALISGSQFLQDPKAQYELQAAKLDNVLKQAQINKTIRETSLLGQPSKEEQKASAAALKSAQASLPAMFDKIATADALSNHAALGAVVGPNFFGRIGKTFRNVTGEAQDFIGGVSKLVNGLTLQNLIEAKAQGATFGALSEGELRLLATSASKIGSWEIKDSDGRVTGYSASEESFKKELETIKELTNRAILLNQGNLFTPDESAELDSLFGGSGTINAAQYF